MSQVKKSEEKNNNGHDWWFLLLIIALFLFSGRYLLDGNKRGVIEQSSREKLPTVDSFDSKLKDADVRQELQKQNVQLENLKAEPAEITPAAEDAKTQEGVNPLTFEQEGAEQRVFKETDGKHIKPTRPVTPDQRISSKLERDEWSDDYADKEKTAYVHQFLENAKQQGLDIRLNKNLEVIDIKKTPHEDPLRFPQSVPQSPK